MIERGKVQLLGQYRGYLKYPFPEVLEKVYGSHYGILSHWFILVAS